MTSQHKVGQRHHYGLIVADALKWDKSGRTVSMYDDSDNSCFYVVEWDETGQYEISAQKYYMSENAGIDYLFLAFNVTL